VSASPRRAPRSRPLLEVEDLTVVFGRKGEEPTTAVDGVSFSVAPGQTVGLVGASGCGKSVTALAIMGLLPRRGVRVSGSVRFEGTELLGLPGSAMRDAAATSRWCSRTRCPRSTPSSRSGCRSARCSSDTAACPARRR